MKRGAKLSSSGSWFHYSWSVLRCAVLYGFARWMVEEGIVNTDYVDSYGRTLLTCALSHLDDPKCLELAKWLIESKGVDIGRAPIGNDGTAYPPAFAAMRFGAGFGPYVWPRCVEFSKWLVERDAHVKDEWGFTPLHVAAMCGDLDSVNWFLRKDVDVNCVTVNKSKVPVMWGSLEGHTRSIGGVTALYYAAFGSHLEVVDLLLEHGADANLADVNGDTPLHIAAKKGDIEIGKLLIDKGGYVNRRNKAGKTPIVVAKENNHFDFAQMLIQDGHATDEEPSSCLVM